HHVPGDEFLERAQYRRAAVVAEQYMDAMDVQHATGGIVPSRHIEQPPESPPGEFRQHMLGMIGEAVVEGQDHTVRLWGLGGQRAQKVRLRDEAGRHRKMIELTAKIVQAEVPEIWHAAAVGANVV